MHFKKPPCIHALRLKRGGVGSKTVLSPALKKEYEVTPSAPPKLPLVASFPTATSHIPDTLTLIRDFVL